MTFQANALHSLKLAKRCMKEGLYLPAVAHMCVSVTRHPSLKDFVKNDFLAVLNHCTHVLERNERWEDALHCYESALEVFGDCEEIHYGLGNLLFRSGHTMKAAQFYHHALHINPNFVAASYSLDCVHNLLVERWHFPMLNDRNRNEKFREAIESSVQQGHTIVLDIGCGTGILSMFAAESATHKVYSCDGSEAMCNICHNVLAANDMSKRVTLIRKMSTEINIPLDILENVSLVVAEIFDAGLFGEHSLKTLHHAWGSLLLPCPSESDTSQQDCNKKFGKVIPKSASVWTFPIDCLWLRKHQSVINKDVGPLYRTAVIVNKSDEPYTSEQLRLLPGGYRQLADPVLLLEVDFNNPNDIFRYLKGHLLQVEINCKNEGAVDAIAIYFDLHLNDHLQLSSSPESGSCWEQAIFQVYDTTNVQQGDIIKLEFFCQEHLMLKELSVKSCTSGNLCNESRKLFLKSDWIRLMNNSEFCSSLSSSLQSVIHSETKVIDISPIPLGALFAAYLGVKEVVVVDSVGYLELLDLCNHLSVPTSSIKFSTVSDLCEQTEGWDVLIFDPIESSGLLRPQVIEDITLLRSSCLNASGKLIPKSLKMMGVLLDSPHLIRTARLESDENVLGFKISQFINSYQVKLQQDLHFTTLPHQSLSDVFKVLEIHYESSDIRELMKITNESTIKAILSGTVSALVFWHEVEFLEGKVMDTSNPSSLYKHGGFVLPNCIHVDSGRIVKIVSIYTQSVLHFNFEIE